MWVRGSSSQGQANREKSRQQRVGRLDIKELEYFRTQFHQFDTGKKKFRDHIDTTTKKLIDHVKCEGHNNKNK